MSVQLVPVGAGVPPEVAPVLKSHEAALRAIQNPRSPSGVVSVTTAQLPAPTGYPPSIAIVSDIPCLAYCDSTHWRKASDDTVIV